MVKNDIDFEIGDVDDVEMNSDHKGVTDDELIKNLLPEHSPDNHDPKILFEKDEHEMQMKKDKDNHESDDAEKNHYENSDKPALKVIFEGSEKKDDSSRNFTDYIHKNSEKKYEEDFFGDKYTFRTPDSEYEKNDSEKTQRYNFRFDEDDVKFRNERSSKSDEGVKSEKDGYERYWFRSMMFGFETYIRKMCRQKPNTFWATIIGIIASILVLTVGFLKTLIIFLIVTAANIIGKILDGEPKINDFLVFVRSKYKK